MLNLPPSSQKPALNLNNTSLKIVIWSSSRLRNLLFLFEYVEYLHRLQIILFDIFQWTFSNQCLSCAMGEYFLMLDEYIYQIRSYTTVLYIRLFIGWLLTGLQFTCDVSENIKVIQNVYITILLDMVVLVLTILLYNLFVFFQKLSFSVVRQM